MVMHARKPQRINDGYFEKHQAHPYQNSKYASSKGNYGERYNHERLRDSPNGNSYRSDSPDSESPRERGYQNKVYMQKIRDKERDRDYKSSRDKYSDCSRSPKEKRSRESRDSEHRTNHERGTDGTRVGDWSEHMSSSGKKYYYNCKTEVSQWEKPREWVERERRCKEERGERGERGYINRLGHDKHSNARASNSTARESSSKGGSGGGERRGDKGRGEEWRSEAGGTQTQTQATQGNMGNMGAAVLSSADRDKAERLEPDRDRRKDGEQAQDMDISPSGTTPSSQPSPHPRLVSASPGPAMAVTVANVPGPPLNPVPVGPPAGEAPQLPQAVSTVSPLLVDTGPSTQAGGEGPPTPTHSETLDGVDARKMSSPPNAVVLPAVTSVAGALPSPSSLQGLAPRGPGPQLTPSLANHYREDLTSHVRGWPAEAVEKQSQRLCEDSHVLASLQCSRVSAELKTARSVVRLNEIQATLHEQRILFLRQQIKTLEELNTQHSFMGDDS